MVDWTLVFMKFEQKSYLFIQGNALENVFEMASVLLWHQFVNPSLAEMAHLVEILLMHYNDVIMGPMASQINSLTIVFSVVNSYADQRKHQSSASLPFVREFTGARWIPRTKGQSSGKMFPFDDVNMEHNDTFILYSHHRGCSGHGELEK